MVLNLPGFAVRAVETKPDGRRYMVAENETTNVVVSLTLEQVKPGAPASSCRESLEKKTKNAPLKIQDVRFSRLGDVDVMQYVVPEFRGQRVTSAHQHARTAREQYPPLVSKYEDELVRVRLAFE